MDRLSLKNAEKNIEDLGNRGKNEIFIRFNINIIVRLC
jgi:hypothetical protein